ncbi:MAG: acyl-coenzyme A thioesterase 13 [Oceanicoccus sp.]|jgi:acyl-coenzyme A thioesterase 13
MTESVYGEAAHTKSGAGRLEGYSTWEGLDPCEDYMGPFYFKHEENGEVSCAFIAEVKHTNSSGKTHGGLLMTFADFSLFAIAQDSLNTGFGVTISLNGEFVSAGNLGDFVEARGRVVRSTRSLVFVQGEVVVGDKTLLNYSGIIKK